MKRGIIFVAAVLAGTAAADFGSVVSSFRLSGTSMPYVTGIMCRGVRYWGALYSAGPDYLLQYNESGSVVGSYVLAGSLTPTDMDYARTSGWYIRILDVGRRALLEYVRTTGSFVGSRPVPANTKGYATIYGWPFLAIGTWVYRYDSNWSILSSFNTGMDIGAIGVSSCLLNLHRAAVIVAPRTAGVFNCYWVTNGSHVASFAVSGSGTKGAHCAQWLPVYFYCNRVTARGMYLYKIDIEGESAVTPASLGRVKALFR